MRTTQPPSIHTAFNPVIINYESEEKQFETATITIGENEISLRAEYFSGKAEIDISQLCKSAFVEGRIASFDLNDNVSLDTRLFAPYTYTDDYGSFDAVAVNAVAQWGESNNIAEKTYQFLTGFNKLRKYDGYELTVSFICNGERIYILNENGASRVNKTDLGHYLLNVTTEKSLIFSNKTGVYTFLFTRGAIAITDSLGEPILISSPEHKYSIMPVINKPTPEHPFYVRWVNRFGGYDYWMMSSVQYATLSAKIDDAIELYSSDTLSLPGGNRRTIKKEASRIIKVSTGQCTIADVKELQYLPLSPLVEWYDESKQAWVYLQCNDTEVELHNCQVTGSIEFEFELPAPLLQF
jgi:hypothetical protein